MRKRKGLKINGMLLLDKPLGMSSNGILQRVRRLFNAQKAGHTGALDPMASGVLPICFGEATKFSSFGLEADKAYIATAQLGVVTETGDSEGAVVKTSVVQPFSTSDIEALLKRFTGTVHQVPSMYSALKYKGRPLYEYARKGETVPRTGRDITIYELRLLEVRDSSFDIYVRCSKGTYIRTLVEDLGAALQCGAHVTMLRRVQSGPYKIDGCHTVEQLEKFAEDRCLSTTLLPVDEIISHLPKISLGNSDTDSILHGQPVRIPGDHINDVYRIYSDEQKFIGIGRCEEGQLSPQRLVASE